MISPAHRQFYDHYGFIHFTGLLSVSELSLLDEMLNTVTEEVIRKRLRLVNGIPIRYGRNERGETVVQRLPFTSTLSPGIGALLSGKGIDHLTGLVGRPDCRLGFNENDGLVTNCFLNTPGSTYRQMGWHTDGLRDLLLARPLLPMINVGFYLDDSGGDNGGLRIIPGTHTSGLRNMLFRKTHLLDKREDPGEFKIIAARGDMVLHSGRLWHRVAKALLTGDNGRRRIMYVPLICGRQESRHGSSHTPLYHKINRFARYQ